jgi:predicted GH43/DUF377 family glycosyl hydrolase
LYSAVKHQTNETFYAVARPKIRNRFFNGGNKMRNIYYLAIVIPMTLILSGSSTQAARFELVDYPLEPVLTPGFQPPFDNHAALDPELLWDGQSVRLYYTAVDNEGVHRIALAVSNDLTTWTPRGVILAPESGSFDEKGVSTPDIVYVDGRYHLYYTGISSGEWRQIGHVSSPDGVQFTNTRSPVLGPSFQNGTFDLIGVSEPSVIYQNNQFQMIYRGHDGGHFWRLGLASSQDGLQFDRIVNSSDMGAIYGRGPHGFEDGGAGQPEIWAENDNDVRMLYTSLHY